MDKYIDIGINLTASSYSDDVEQVIERAQKSGVEQLIVTGTDVEHSEQALLLSERYPARCYATVGLHPHHASDYSSDVDSELRDMLMHENARAVGECGLDFNRNYSTRQEQLRAFEAQLEIAIDMRLPLFLHQRDAHQDFLSILKNCRHDLGHVVAHCFTGSVEELHDYMQLDLHVGVTGWICDERRGAALQQAVRQISLDRIMLETDAPYLLPRDLSSQDMSRLGLRKNRNEPCVLPHIASVVARYMDVDTAALAVTAYENSRNFFSITSA